eukprot:scaffold148861_cov28-Tisochrysis_lutea.AAC.5
MKCYKCECPCVATYDRGQAKGTCKLEASLHFFANQHLAKGLLGLGSIRFRVLAHTRRANGGKRVPRLKVGWLEAGVGRWFSRKGGELLGCYQQHESTDVL